jgi:2-iminoacetate synthase ThiH
MIDIADKVRHAIIRRAYGRDDFVDSQTGHFIGAITIVPNNICNAECVFCAYRLSEEPKSTMSLDLFKRVID